MAWTTAQTQFRQVLLQNKFYLKELYVSNPLQAKKESKNLVREALILVSNIKHIQMAPNHRFLSSCITI